MMRDERNQENMIQVQMELWRVDGKVNRGREGGDEYGWCINHER